jgi:UDP-N-acetylmuramyl pentapeptide phosphotransferase/UDP-N-acetylglucosamine-1-phosphate transferase
VPANAIRRLRTTSTWEDGQEIAQAVHETGVSRLLVVTNWYHGRRALGTVRRELADDDVEVLFSPPPPLTYGPHDWWRQENGLVAVVNEYIKIGFYWWHYGLAPWECQPEGVSPFKMGSNKGGIVVPLGFLFLAFSISYLGTFVVRRWAVQSGVVDIPNERSSHDRPTPRGGGMAIVASFFAAMLLASFFYTLDSRTYWGLFLSAAAIAVLGFIDDLHSLSKRRRFVVWIVIAGVSMVFGIRLRAIALPVVGVIPLGILSPLVTFVWLIGVANLYNFMDGIDGLAGGEAVSVAGFLVVISLLYGNTFIFIASLILLGSALGFLLHNLPPARIFMGDGGSNFLGFVFAALAIIGSQSGAASVPFVIPIILLGTFLFDATITLLKRIPRGRKWLEPHRDHYYQRLVILGYSHKRVTSLYCLLSILLGFIALLYSRMDGLPALILLVLALLLLLALAVVVNKLESVDR